MDIWSKQKRSQVMARIRGKNTKPEKLVKSALRNLGYNYRSHVKTMPGCPDIVLSKLKTVIFINGCFWHQHQQCKRPGIPIKRPQAFWRKKFEANAIRLKRQTRLLRKRGWSVFVIWECQLRNSRMNAMPEIDIVKTIINKIRKKNGSRKRSS